MLEIKSFKNVCSDIVSKMKWFFSLLSGACITLKDPSLAVAVECCLRSFMKAFCCDNYKDEAVLQELMSRYYPKGNRPQIIVSPFSEKVYNIHGRWAAAAAISFQSAWLSHALQKLTLFKAAFVFFLPWCFVGKHLIQNSHLSSTCSQQQVRSSWTAWLTWEGLNRF